MNDIKSSTQFVITEVSLNTKIGKLDITGIYEEINIFDSLFNPCMSGNILIRDSNSLSNSVLFDGSEKIFLKISKTSDDSFSIEKTFRIYKQTDRQIVNQTTELYILHFISEEFINSELTTISRAYDATYGESILRVIKDFLYVEDKNINIIENTFGVKKFIVPNLKPIDSIIWMAKKSIDTNGLPTFLFFENIDGYNFVSLSSLISNDFKIKVFFNPKNLGESPIENLFNVRSFETIQQFDTLNLIKSGVFSGTFIGSDIGSNLVSFSPISFFDWYEKLPHLNSSPNVPNIVTKKGNAFLQFKSRITHYPAHYLRNYNEIVKETDKESLSHIDDTEKYIFQRKPIFSNFLNQRVKLIMPGNFALTSGIKLELNYPNYGIRVEGSSNMDKTLLGNYLIIATRHIIKYNTHETIIEASTDSSNRVENNKILTGNIGLA